MTSTLEKVYLYGIKIGIYALFFIPLLLSKEYFFPYIFGKAILLRSIIEVVAVLFILLVLLNSKYMPKRSYLFWGVVFYMVIKAATTLTGVNPYHSFWSNYERMEGFLTLVHFGILFVVMAGVFRSQADWKWVFRVAALGGFLVAVIGVLQKLDLGPICIWPFRCFEVINSGVGKIDSTIGNSSYVAAYLIYSVFILLYLFFKDKNLYWRIAYGLVFLTDLAVIFFTVSRGGVLGLIFGIILLMLLVIFGMPNTTIRKGYKLAAVGFLALIIISGAVFFASKNQKWVQENYLLRKLTTISFTNRTIQDRVINWKISWLGFKERFFTGYGMENYYVPFNKYYNSKTSEPWFDRAHNIIADQAVTGGIFGLLSYLFLVFGSIFFLWRERNKDYLTSFIFMALIGASFFANLFVFDNSSTYTMFFTVLAFVDYKVVREKYLARIFQWLKRFIIKDGPVNLLVPISLGVILVMCLYFFNIKPAMANKKAIEAYKYSKVNHNTSAALFKEAMDFRTFGDVEIALRVGDLAMNIAEDSSDKAEQKRAMDFATEAFNQAIALEPENARIYLYLANLDLVYFNNAEKTEEYYTKALDNLNKVKELSPDRQEVYFSLGQLMLLGGKTQEGVSDMEKAAEINPDRLALYNLLSTYLSIGKEYNNQEEELFSRIDKEGFFATYDKDRIERLVGIYYGRDDFSKIQKILETAAKAIEDKPDRAKEAAEYYGKLAGLYKELGNEEKAREDALMVEKLDPDKAEEVKGFLESL